MSTSLDAIGIVVSDMARSVAFFRLLGVPFGDPGEEDHLEAALPSGVRLMLDTEKLVRTFDPEWERPVGSSIGLAFLCLSPARVDEVYARSSPPDSRARRNRGTRSGASATPKSSTPTATP